MKTRNAISRLAVVLPTIMLGASLHAQQNDPLAVTGPTPAELVGEAAGADPLRRARDAFVAAGDFTAALEPATAVVAAGEADDPRYVEDRLLLARIQAELRRFDDAETNYLAAIGALEDRDGETSQTLVDPYQGLGRSYLNARRFTEAITVLEHARDISQRNTGLFNVEQSEIIDDITMAYLGTGDTDAARRLQQQRLNNAIRRFGADDPRLAPFHSHLGDYYDSSRLRASAREQYERALELQQGDAEAGPATDLGPLRKLVGIELALGDSDEAQQELLAELQRNAAIAGIERGLSLALLGDAAIAREDFGVARDFYLQAYRAFAASGNVDPVEYFGRPQMIDFVAPLSSVDRGARRDPYAWGSIVLEFDVSAEGRATNVETVELTPPGETRVDYGRRLRETHFRPELVDGVPVSTSNVRLTHYFRYYVDDD
jgi:tetratricopeptide (TPR) repeat protein